MGGSQSSVCRHPINPDLRSVFTLSDSAVQRLPLDVSDNPLEREQRKQNIDDFWRDRIECIDQTFLDAKLITETEFKRLEFSIKNKTGTSRGKPLCMRGLEDTKNCYLAFPQETINCRSLVDKLLLCLNTMLQESSKKKAEEDKKGERRTC